MKPVHRLDQRVARALIQLQSPALLLARAWVAWAFLQSGWLKLTQWESTLWLFQEEYRVPLLPALPAAVLGTAGEIVFPLLLVAGLWTRLAALGLFAVNLMAVLAYRHVLLAAGYEAALADHVVWGLLLGAILLFGPGACSLDRITYAASGSGEGRAIT